MRRSLAVIFAAVLLLLTAAGFAYWRDTRFPARAQPLIGTPVVLRVQDGVKPRELRAVRTGLRDAQRYMRKTFHRTVRGPVEARVARANSCRPLESSGGAMVGEATGGFLCIDTAALHWQWIVLKDLAAATSTSAHEYVHVLQAEIGCLPGPNDEQYRWIYEGMASDVAWQALVGAGHATETRVARTIRMDGAFDTNLEPLVNYERGDGRDREYALWHLAIRALLRDAVARRAAPASRPELALLRFCERVGRGRSWRTAFARSFGLPLARFYARFEAARQRDSLSKRLFSPLR
jgi:hypothetical protein